MQIKMTGTWENELTDEYYESGKIYDVDLRIAEKLIRYCKAIEVNPPERISWTYKQSCQEDLNNFMHYGSHDMNTW